ncbi:MAG: twin-arginine translocation signal domain-containing protein [Candidatus Acetothermia bacterium]|jgi:hypothetical protein|nr:twin-arginine translocation signal domain-containing protein [Candidatus Acetothermia bacterium]MDH7505944.1 twin-arginine translocation signal domain-containing protein [Candidatus Acetothermia bacterium]
MEKRQLDRRSFLKYAGAGSLAAATLLIGGTKAARAQLGPLLELLGKIPGEVLDKLPEAIAKINNQPEAYMERFMTAPRVLLKDEFGIKLPYTEYQLITLDLSPEETLWPKVLADPAYPYAEGVSVGSACAGFAEGRVGLVIRSRA